MYAKYVVTSVCALSLFPSLLFPVGITANSVSIQTKTNTAQTITLSGKGAKQLSFVITKTPMQGTLSSVVPYGSKKAHVTYTPNTDFEGTDSFTYQAFKDFEFSENATVTIVVTGPPPVVRAVTERTMTGTPVVVSLEGSDAANKTLTFSIVSPPTRGSLSAVTQVPPNSAQVDYVPTGDWTGSDTFTYKANNGTTDSNLGVATVIVNKP